MNQIMQHNVLEVSIATPMLPGRTLMKRIINPFSNMLATFDPQRFFGRRYFRELILPGVSSLEPRSFAVSGLPSVGKTSLLKYFCHPEGARLLDADLLGEYRPGDRPDRRLDFIYIDCFSVRPEAIWHFLYSSLSEAERLREDVSSPIGVNGDAQQVKHALEAVLKRAHGSGLRLVICLDNLDTTLQSISSEEESYLRYLTTFAALVIATEKTLVELNKERLGSGPNKKLSSLSPLMQVVFPRSLGLLTEDEAKELVLAPTRDLGEEHRFTEQEVEFLIEVAGRQPYLLTLVCDFVFNLRLEDPRLSGLLSTNYRVREQVKRQMESLLEISDHFALFWGQLGEAEQRTLLKIANGESPDSESEQLALRDLRKKALIYEDLHKGEYHVFSGLFSDYVRRQREPSRTEPIEDIASSLPPLDRKLFMYLVKHPHQLRSFDDLCEQVWMDPNVSKRGVEAAIHRVRVRIQEICGTDWDYVQNVRGIGYKYVPKTT